MPVSIAEIALVTSPLSDVLLWLSEFLRNQYQVFWRQSPIPTALVFLAVLVVIGLVWWPQISKRARQSLQERLARLRDNPFRKRTAKVQMFFLYAWLSWPAGIVLSLLLLWVSYSLVDSYGERLLLKFKDGKMRILVTDFAGPDLTPQFGRLGFREKILTQLKFYFPGELANEVDVLLSAKRCRSQQDAEAYCAAMKGDLVIWGAAEQGTETLFVNIGFGGFKTLQFRPAYAETYSLNEAIANHVRVPLAGRGTAYSQTLVNWTNVICLHALLALIAPRGEPEKTLDVLRNLEAYLADRTADECLMVNLVKTECFEELADWKQMSVAAQNAIGCLDSLPDLPNRVSSAITGSLAFAQLRMGDSSQATASFAKALSADSLNTEAARLLVMLYRAQKLYREAGYVASRMARSDSLNPRWSRELAFDLSLQGRQTEAAEPALHAYYLSPNDTLTQTVAAVMCLDAEEFDSCVTLLERIRAERGDLTENQWYFWIVAKSALGDIDTAKTVIVSLQGKYSCLRLGFIDLWHYAWTRRDTADAVWCYRAVLATDSSHLAACASRLGRPWPEMRDSFLRSKTFFDSLATYY